jgi:hypothetical protein
MATKYKEMVKAAALTGTAGTALYAAPALTYGSIHAASANNPTGGAVTVNLYKVPAGQSAGNATRIASRNVQAGSQAPLLDAINHKLEPGTQLFADGNGCFLNVSGVEYTPEQP